MKKCNKCEKEKDELEFHNDNSTLDGLTNWCAECRQKSTEAWLQTERGKQAHRDSERLRRALNPERVLLDLAKARAKKNNLEFNIDIDDIIIPNICPVLGIPIKSGVGKTIDSSPTIDRINNNLGYVKGNIKIISWRANKLKSDATSDELYRVLCYMMGGSVKRPKGSYAISWEFNGKVQTLEAWAKEYNLSLSTLNNRVNRMKWSIEKALNTPVKKKEKSH